MGGNLGYFLKILSMKDIRSYLSYQGKVVVEDADRIVCSWKPVVHHQGEAFVFQYHQGA
jgi:hypothetical protein